MMTETGIEIVIGEVRERLKEIEIMTDHETKSIAVGIMIDREMTLMMASIKDREIMIEEVTTEIRSKIGIMIETEIDEINLNKICIIIAEILFVYSFIINKNKINKSKGTKSIIVHFIKKIVGPQVAYFN